MKITHIVLKSANAAYVCLLVGCTTSVPEPPSAEVATSQDAVHIDNRIVIEPGQKHDFTSADPEGAVQFEIKRGRASSVPTLLARRTSYVDESGNSVGAVVEIDAKERPNGVALVRASQPLRADAWYTVKIAVDAELEIADEDRGNRDGFWTLRMFTGSNPQVVGLEVGERGLVVRMSEPVDWRQYRPSVRVGGVAVSGCMETTQGCTDNITEPLLDETIVVRVPPAGIKGPFELSFAGAPASGLRIADADWRRRSDGTQVWRRFGSRFK